MKNSKQFAMISKERVQSVVRSGIHGPLVQDTFGGLIQIFPGGPSVVPFYKDKNLCRSNKLFDSDADCIADTEVDFGGSKFSIFENAFGKTGVCAPHAENIIR